MLLVCVILSPWCRINVSTYSSHGVSDGVSKEAEVWCSAGRLVGCGFVRFGPDRCGAMWCDAVLVDAA